MTGFDIFAIALVLAGHLYAVCRRQDGAARIRLDHRAVRQIHPHALAGAETSSSPISTASGRKINMMEQVISIPEQEVITKDNATVTVDGVAFYQCLMLRKPATSLQSQPGDHRFDHDQHPLGDGAMDLDQVLSHRDEINERLPARVDAAVSPWD